MKNTLLFTLLSFLSISLFAQSNPAITNSIVENHLYHTNNGQGKGFYEGTNLITKEVFLNKLNSIPSIAGQYESGRNMKMNGTLFIGVGIGLTIVSAAKSLSSFSAYLIGLGSSSSSPNNGSKGITAGIIFTALGTGIIIADRKQKRKVINAYNESISGKVDLSFGIRNNGLGLFVNF